MFTRFTLGSFVELFIDVDERDRGVLMARQRDRALLPVDGLSKGTREQLFLALRIAAIVRARMRRGGIREPTRTGRL
jgi:uncharacterized protein YhaN